MTGIATGPKTPESAQHPRERLGRTGAYAFGRTFRQTSLSLENAKCQALACYELFEGDPHLSKTAELHGHSLIYPARLRLDFPAGL